MSMLGLQGSFLILDILSLAQDTLPFAGRNSGDFLLLCHLNHSYIINTTQFLLLQAHLQTYLLQYLMKLMVLFMHQLQLIGIKTNLESFVTTTLMEHMLNRHQLHLFLWVSKQWGIISNNKAIFPLVFNVFVSSALLLSRGSGTGTWYGDSSNITLTGISCVTPDYVLSGTYIAIGA